MLKPKQVIDTRVVAKHGPIAGIVHGILSGRAVNGQVKIRQQDIADQIGITRTTISAQFRELYRGGLVRQTGWGNYEVESLD